METHLKNQLMINEIRMYLSEVFLHLVLYLVPKTDNGLRLRKSIKKYTENELNIKHYE